MHIMTKAIGASQKHEKDPTLAPPPNPSSFHYGMFYCALRRLTYTRSEIARVLGRSDG
jgi:hypothetical protein